MPLGTLAAAGRLSVDPASEETESEDDLGWMPGRRGRLVLGPSCMPRRGTGDDVLLVGGAGVGSRDEEESVNLLSHKLILPAEVRSVSPALDGSKAHASWLLEPNRV